ncbi:MAG: DUF2271 domain-containing protein [Acidimicrobiales bacterium]
MTENPLPRFEAVQRRAFLKRATMLGAVGLVPGLACGTDDADTFTKSAVVSTTAAAAASTTTAPGATTTPGSTAAPSTAAPSTSASAGGTALPSKAELTVEFTYAVADSGFGPARNPYIAVWIESAAGELVRNISVWYEAGRGERWLNELPSWYSADQAYYDAHQSLDFQSVSGATRPAGTYQVVWNGKDESGGRATAGDYVVFVESNREHGTHSLTSTPITLGSKAVTAKMADQGDLSAASVAYAV